MASIHYAVIALKRPEVEQVIAQLNAGEMKAIAGWLDARKEIIYGKKEKDWETEDWMPFNGKRVCDLLNSDKTSYYSETHMLDELNEDLSNKGILNDLKIDIYFFDVFALFHDRGKKLAGMLDTKFADSPDVKCCLVMPYGLSDDCNYFFTTYSKVCNGLETAYKQGFFHPLVLRADDLTHLRNYLLKQLPEEAEGNKGQQIDMRHGQGPKHGFGLRVG
jgi:hypothetical protein